MFVFPTTHATQTNISTIHTYPCRSFVKIYCWQRKWLKKFISKYWKCWPNWRERERKSLGIKLGSTFPFCIFHSETKTKTKKNSTTTTNSEQLHSICIVLCIFAGFAAEPWWFAAAAAAALSTAYGRSVVIAWNISSRHHTPRWHATVVMLI